MGFDFDLPYDRRGTGAVKWDELPDGGLPMWIADMDFPTAPAVSKAIEERASHHVYGYTDINVEWRAAYAGWWEKRHGFSMDPEKLIFSTGVIPTISSSVRRLTSPGEKVLILTPVYNIFYNSIINNGRFVLECPLAYDGEEYSIDWDDLEKGLSDPQTSMMLLCNPANPVGKIWDRETLARIGELCSAYGVVVVSDEIHCDITAPGKGYVPFASASPVCAGISVTCVAPTKCFNIAGIGTSAAYAEDPVLRHKVWRQLNTDECGEPNVFAIPAAVAAFTEGGEWLDSMREYVFKNRALVSDYIAAELPCLKAVKGDATYLVWIDCSDVCGRKGIDSAALCDHITETTGLRLSDGVQYGKGGEMFLRMNVACPSSYVRDGLERLKKAVNAV